MEPTRATWTDERLDDLSQRVESGFDRVDGDLRALRSDMNNRFEAVETRADAHFHSLQRLIIQVGGAMFATTLATIVSVLVTRG